MSINLLNLQPVQASTDLSSYTSLIYGVPKIGKTTFIHNLYGKRVLFVATEKRHKVLVGAYVQYVGSWSDYQALLAQLRNPEVKKQFDVVCIDTAENLYGYLEAFIAARYQEQQVGERNDLWGADWNDLKKSWKEGIQMIERLGYTPVFVSHATKAIDKIPASGIISAEDAAEIGAELKKDKKTKEEFYEFERYVPDLPARALAPINKMVDNILFMNLTVDTSGNEQRVIHLRETLQWQAGSTFTGIQPVVKLDAEEYKKAVSDAIGLIDPEFTKSEKEDTSILDQKRSFEDVMNDAKALGKRFAKAKQGAELTAIVDKIFGTGVLLTSASPAQQELVETAIVQMNARAEELGI